MTGLLGGNRHEYYMAQALREAAVAAEEGEVPVGALIIHERGVIARAHNQRERLRDPTAHAEMIAITQAAEFLQTWRLAGCTMVVTLEPCAMCAGALVLARMDRLVFGAFDPKAGACGSVLDVIGEPKLNHHMEVISGVLEDECGAILSEFFRARRVES
ncbi:MAG: tRNA adenosine(34) deaminase TadA [Planctomycetes bacterium]|nr:tRNA adenosine(34) deaminase TadA [Planctomycetota bacterium]